MQIFYYHFPIAYLHFHILICILQLCIVSSCVLSLVCHGLYIQRSIQLEGKKIVCEEFYYDLYLTLSNSWLSDLRNMPRVSSFLRM